MWDSFVKHLDRSARYDRPYICQWAELRMVMLPPVAVARDSGMNGSQRCSHINHPGVDGVRIVTGVPSVFTPAFVTTA